MRHDCSEQDRAETIKHRRLRFDGTITMGNLVSLVGMLSAVLALWRNMETRIMLVEERQAVQARSVEKLLTSVERLALMQATVSRDVNERN